jgi:exodeoxyribonuclease V alpha subunit
VSPLAILAQQVNELLEMDLGDRLPGLLKQMQQDGLLMVRELAVPEGASEPCCYSKTRYYDELYVAKKISAMNKQAPVDRDRVAQWVSRYCQARGISLSDEQAAAVIRYAHQINKGELPYIDSPFKMPEIW